MSDDIEVWKQRNEILHKKVERLMEELRQEHKLRQEAEGELAIIKATTILPFSAVSVFLIITVSPSFIPASIIESP